MKQEITNYDILDAINKLDNKVDIVKSDLKHDINDLKQDFADLADSTATGFTHVENRLESLENGQSWTKDMLEHQTTTLARLDQERLLPSIMSIA